MNRLRKKWLFILLFALSATLMAWYINKKDFFPSQFAQFQKTFREKEIGIERFLKEKRKQFAHGVNVREMKTKLDEAYAFYYYVNDSLAYWNSNVLPVGRFADIHFPSNGLVHLQNGWYYAVYAKDGNKTFCAAFLIKSDYPYENNDLTNEFHPDFKLDRHTGISLDSNEGSMVNDRNGHFIFSLIPSMHADESSSLSQWMLFFYVGIFALWMYLSVLVFNALRTYIKWLIPLLLVLLKYFALKYSWFDFHLGAGALDPSIYAISIWSPNFFEYLTNILVVMTVLSMLELELPRLPASKIYAFLLLVTTILLWIPIRQLSKGLVENSSIPLTIHRPYSLNGYSVLAVVSVGAFMFTLYRFMISAVALWIRCKLKPYIFYVISFILFVLLCAWISIVWNEEILTELPAFVFMAVLIFDNFRKVKVRSLFLSVLVLSLGVLSATALIFTFNLRRDVSMQEFFAKKLTVEQNIATELEYLKIKEKISTDPVLTHINPGNASALSSSAFEFGLERRIFSGFWERYALDFFLFDSIGNVLMSVDEGSEEFTYPYLSSLIEQHGKRSSIDEDIFFIGDRIQQLSYVIRQTFYSSTREKRMLWVTLKSKKIPEEIGFPRLLISGNAQALQSLENYSIAKYHDGRLIINYGRFNYPYRLAAVYGWKRHENFRIKDNFRHVVMRSTSNDVCILSAEQTTLFSFISSFSYLFIFFGLFSFSGFFSLKRFGNMRQSLGLSARFQFILLGILFLSLLAFGWSSRTFVKRQYEVFSKNMIADKLRSMSMEINGKLTNLQTLNLEKHGNRLQATLEKIGRIYRTDLNLYDASGFMIASSRAKIYRLGLLGDQINSAAFRALNFQRKGNYILEEHIGKLVYTSAYMPCFNRHGKLLGFLNLPYFSQQRELEEQMETFIVSIINVFMLLFALFMVSALFISNWLTTPLRMLKEHLLDLKLGGMNKPIAYTKEDEIGALVAAYNMKLKELEFTAEQLTKSERENAWKEMAKQVAHEIKNPLTPMKLSVQHFLRSFDPADPLSTEKMKRVGASLIEQIDALTHIANEFSVFAQMPSPNESEIDLVDVIKNVIHVFQESANENILLDAPNRKILIKADKDQLLRVFNNLLKNAVQSASAERELFVYVRVKEKKGKVIVTVQDNGVGIPLHEQQKIFTPHFTTKSAGSGLGLAMVKQIVENHQGQVSFESKPDVGSIFKMVLPKYK